MAIIEQLFVQNSPELISDSKNRRDTSLQTKDTIGLSDA